MTSGNRAAALAALALLLLLLYFFTSSGTKSETDSAEKALFPGLAPERTESLLIRFRDGGEETYRFIRRNDEWSLKRGDVFRPVREERIREALRELAGLTIGGSIAEEQSARERLEVTSEKADVVEVTYRSPEEEVRAAVYIGVPVPGTSRRYVRPAGELTVFSVKAPEFLEHSDIDHWTDLRLFPAHPEPSDVIRLHMQSFRGDELELLRRESLEGEWYVKHGGGGEVLPAQGSERVLQFVRTLFTLRGESFAASCDAEKTPLIRIAAESGRGETYRLQVHPGGSGSGYIICTQGGNERAPRSFHVREQDFSLLSNGLERILESVSH